MTHAEFLDKRYHYSATCVKVHDGDTISVVVQVGFNLTMAMTLRLLGINAPEIVGETHAAGVVSRDALAAMVLNKSVCLVTERDRTEKYGRYLATVYRDDGGAEMVNVNDTLVSAGLAVPYNP